MTPVTTFAGKTVALFGLGGSGLATALALKAGGAQWSPATTIRRRWRSQREGHRDRRSARRRLVALRGLRPLARRAADPSRAALVGELASGRRRDHRRHRAVLPRAGEDRAERALRRRSPAPTASRRRRRLIAHILREAAATCRWAAISAPRSCRSSRPPANRIHVVEMLVVPDRPGAVARADGRRPPQPLARSSRPARDHGELRGDQGAAGRRAAGRRRDRRRRAHAPAIAGACRGEATVAASPSRAERPAASTRRANLDHARSEGGRRSPDLGHRLAARRAQCAERGGGAAAASLARPRRSEAIRGGLRPSPACRTAWRRSAAAADALRQRFQGDQRGSTEKALTSFDRIFWILGGKAKEGGIEPLRAISRRSQGLSDRRGTEDVRAATLDGRCRFGAAGTLDKAVELAAADAVSSRRRAGRAAVAGLRVLRPVSELRGARRPFPRSRPGPARHRTHPRGA